MKAGDIVYFKSEYKARYSRQGGSYEYYFKPGDRYRIETINGVGTNYKLIDRGNEKFIMYVIYNENISDSEKEDIFNSIQKIIEDGK